MPDGESKTDEYFGTQQVYHHGFAGMCRWRAPAGGPLEVPLKVTYQGCATRGTVLSARSPRKSPSDYPQLPEPRDRAARRGFSVHPQRGPQQDPLRDPRRQVAVQAAPFVSEQDRFAALIRSGNLLVMLGGFFLAGLVLAFTPCVLPMVPILSGIIAGQGQNVTTRRAFLLSLTYVLGMSLTYTVAGAVFAAAGKQAQSVFQQPWILALFAALFVALALSMFGAFTLQMPAAIQTRIAT